MTYFMPRLATDPRVFYAFGLSFSPDRAPSMSAHPTIRSPHLDGVEVAWFSALCDDDFEFLGVQDERLRSSWPHCRDIVLAADRLGFDNILLPSGYVPGQNALTFAGGMAALVERISLLVAIRCGEYHPPMLARAIASLDHMLDGRLTVNIISSDMPGTKLDSASRYRRSGEVIQILRQAWTQDRIGFAGEFYEFDMPSEPCMCIARPTTSVGSFSL